MLARRALGLTRPPLPAAVAPCLTRRRLFAAESGGSSEGGAKRGLGPDAKRNYYDILGIQRTAKPRVVKSSYLKLAKKFHPDANPGDAEAERQFKEVQEAYDTLSNSWKKTLYDQNIQFGAAKESQGVTKEDWTSHWESETEDQRDARRERYRRYAAGVRNDLPDYEYFDTIRGTFYFICVTTAVGYYCIAKAPDWFDLQNEDTFNDPAFDDTAVPLVKAYHNPVTKKWERLVEGEDPPEPQELYDLMAEVFPKEWKWIDKEQLPRLRLTAMSVPRTQTTVPYLARTNGKLLKYPRGQPDVKKRVLQATSGSTMTIPSPGDLNID